MKSVWKSAAGAWRGLQVLLLSLSLAACGGGGGSAGNPINGGGGGGGGGGSTPTVTMELSLQDAAGSPVSNIAIGTPVRARAVLKRAGVAVANEIVTFTAEQSTELVKFDPSSGSLLTNAEGVAQITVTSLGVTAGAGRVRASATVGTTDATATANFYALASSGQQPVTLVLSPVSVGSPTVTSYGTTGVTVQVLENGAPYTAAPVTVTFTTSCPVNKATINGTAITQPNGTAVATFSDNGCAQNGDTLVTITAAIATDTKTGTTTVRAPSTGSLRFLSVVPADKSITLRGQGGNGRQENASVTFQLVDQQGQGVGNADVCFDSTTYVGDLNIDGFTTSRLPPLPGSTALCGSDVLSVVRYVKRTNADGTVTVQVNSGTVPTPVRVRARTIYPVGSTTLVESFSDTLSVSTGLPLQRSMSLSVDRANIDGGNFDGEIAILTVRLADQFSNPVPDGTVVNFIASGAAVCTADNGSCRTSNGACSCNVVSQERRPQDRRVVVTAYAVGLEDYDDRNGDNVYTLGTDPFVDLGDAYVDANKDGAPGSQTINADTDILVPYKIPNVYSAVGDGVRGTAHIRRSTVIYLSQSSSNGRPSVVIPLDQLQRNRFFDGTAGVDPYIRLTPFCPEGTPLPTATFVMRMEDGIGNPMAAGTSLGSIDNSDNLSVGAFRPAAVAAFGARPPSPAVDLPNVPKPLMYTRTNDFGTVTTEHSVTVRGVQDKCSGNAGFSMQVASPRGGASIASIYYEGDARINAGRGRFDVRYLNEVEFSLTNSAALTASMTPTSWTEPAAGAPAAVDYQIDWGDATVETFPISAAPRTHVYATAGSKVVTVTVRAGAFRYSATRSVTVN